MSQQNKIDTLLEDDIWPLQFVRSKKFLSFIDLIPEGVVISNTEGEIIQINQEATALFKYSREEMLSASIEDLVPDEIRSKHADLRQWFFNNPRPRYIKGRTMPLSGKQKNSGIFAMDAALFAIKTDEGPLAINLIHNISQQKIEELKLSEAANHDPLTKLPNRMYFDRELEKCLAINNENNKSTALLFIDLDKFKPVNDKFGHATGDKILKETAQRLQEAVRTEDFVARFGGDEFCVIISLKKGDTKTALQIAERILTLCSTPFIIDDNNITISASIGLSITDGISSNSNNLIANADNAMYCAKKQGQKIHFDKKTTEV